MIAGLASQVASLAVFMMFCGDYALRLWRTDRVGARERGRIGVGKLCSTGGWLKGMIAGELKL